MEQFGVADIYLKTEKFSPPVMALGPYICGNSEFIAYRQMLHIENICSKLVSFYSNYCDEITGERKGSIEELYHSDLAEQGITSFDWSPDKIGLAVCSSFDQAVRLLYITQLHIQ